jgi:uncharacterized membrane protein SpoIIM required for sporulation
VNEERFVQLREPDWQRLVHLCDRADASPTFLNTSDFHELIRCYRRTSGDLATARTIGSNPEMTTFLNDIVGRAYAILYRSPRKSFFAGLGQVLATVAQAGRRRKWFILSAALGFFVFTFLTFGLMSAVPATRDVFLPPGGMMQENAKGWTKGIKPRTASQSAMMTGMYASNNPLAAITGASLSVVSFGIGGAYDLYENGMNTGALAYEMNRAGKLSTLVIWLLPHGVSEIQGFFVSVGAGFVLGWALINPGRRRRGEALAEAGKDAIVLIATSIVMMFIAAPFEGYFSFNPRVPNAVKIVVAVLVACAWAAFWIGFGREDALAAPASE